MTNYEYWSKKWDTHREKASAALKKLNQIKPFDMALWKEYCEETKKSNHAYGVLLRCKVFPKRGASRNDEI